MIDPKNILYKVAFIKLVNGKKTDFIGYQSTVPLMQPLLHDAVDIKDQDTGDHIVGIITKIQFDTGLNSGSLTQRVLAYVE